MTSTAEDTIARLKEKAGVEAGEDTEEEAGKAGEAGEVEETEEPTKKHSDTREYIVLQTWTEAGRFTAATSKGAVEALGEDKIKSGHKYVAVPARNWNEHEAAIETKTTITIK